MPIVVTSPVTAVVVGADSLGDGSAGAPVVSFLSDQTTGVYLSAGATVGVACGGAVKFEFSAAALNCHNIALTNVGDITCKATGQAITNLNAVTGIAAGADVTAVKTLVGIAAGVGISAVGTFAGIGAGAVCTSVASIAGIGAGMALTSVASSAGIAAGQAISAVASVAGIAAGADITATKTITGIAAGVDISAVKSFAFIAGKGAITNCSSIDSPDATTSASGQMSAADKKFLDSTHSAAGANLTDTATQSIQVSGGSWRKLPTLSQGGTLTVATTGAVAGDQMTITRTSTHAFSYAVVNGGSGAGTLFTFPASKSGFLDIQFDGTDWALKRAYAIP